MRSRLSVTVNTDLELKRHFWSVLSYMLSFACDLYQSWGLKYLLFQHLLNKYAWVVCIERAVQVWQQWSYLCQEDNPAGPEPELCWQNGPGDNRLSGQPPASILPRVRKNIQEETSHHYLTLRVSGVLLGYESVKLKKNAVMNSELPHIHLDIQASCVVLRTCVS